MIHIVDSLMGTGKTSSIINFINASDDDKHFIYVTPYLEEVNRIIKCCQQKHFKQPINMPKKLDGLKRLLSNGENIVTTHALFQSFDQTVREACEAFGYILIMDEVADVAHKYDEITPDDIKDMMHHVDIDDDNTLHWTDANYEGKFDTEKILCELGCLTMYNKDIMMWTFPASIFSAFKESYILTYMFDAQIQKYYYDYYDMQYDYMYVMGDAVDNYQITYDKQNYILPYDYKGLINICQDEKLNQIGQSTTALSKSWYDRHSKTAIMKQIKNNTYNFFRFKSYGGGGDNHLWTTFKDYQQQTKGKGYSNAFLACNARATNVYSNRHNVAYLLNRYMDPTIEMFFKKKQITVDNDGFGLSEMIQFIWRSAIRKGEPISAYIPSSRMRNLLINWLNEISNQYKIKE